VNLYPVGAVTILIGNYPAIVRHKFADDQSGGGIESARADDDAKPEGKQRLDHYKWSFARQTVAHSRQ
jgi:hypothetical protein